MTEEISAESRTKLKPLACPDCGQGFNRTYHKRSKADADTGDVTFRTYKCDECGRIYRTQEQRIESSVASAMVLSEAGEEPFSRTQFEHDLDRYIPKGLTAAERKEVASDVERRVSEHLQLERQSQPASAELEPLPVLKLVELALRGFSDAAQRSWHGHSDGQNRVRVGHAMYALATLGRTWSDASQFINWLENNYPHLRSSTDAGRPTDWNPRAIKWTVPQQPLPTTIHRVVKNQRELPTNEGPARRTKRDFEQAKMRGSIALALQGHEKHDTKTDKVMNYVLWGLVGQRVVRTSQLSSAIAEALRGMHDIAYLRWVAIGKELDLSQLHDEAIALVTHPSPRLSISTYDQTRPPARPGDLNNQQSKPGRTNP